MRPRFSLWHSKGTRSLRILWTLEELALKRGRDYTLHALKFPPRARQKEFLGRNSLGTVPWFEHQESHDAEPRAAMSESCAVPLYVSQLLDSSLTLRLGVDRDYPAFLNWLAAADATLTFPQSIVLRYGVYEPGRAAAASEDYAKWFHARLRLLNAALEDGRDYLVGDRFTVADVCVGYALFLASADGPCGAGLVRHGQPPLSARLKPQTAAYLERLTARTGFRSALAVQEEAIAEAGIAPEDAELLV